MSAPRNLSLRQTPKNMAAFGAGGLFVIDMKTLTVNNCKEDKYYPRLVRAVASILSRSDMVAHVKVVMEIGKSSKKNHEAWRRGSVIRVYVAQKAGYCKPLCLRYAAMVLGL